MHLRYLAVMPPLCHRPQRHRSAILGPLALLVLAWTGLPALAQQPQESQQPEQAQQTSLHRAAATAVPPSLAARASSSEFPAPAYVETTPLQTYENSDPYDPEWADQEEHAGGDIPSLFSTVDWYISSGVVAPLGGGFFEKRIEPGWIIRGGVRQPLSDPHDRSMWFAELGGSYARNDGRGGRVLTSGSLFGRQPDDNHIHALDEFFQTQLQDLRRASAHVALGWCYPYGDSNGRRVQLSFRAGPRVGHVRAEFDHDPTPALQVLIDDHFGHGHQQVDLRTDVKDTDTFFGLFTSVGLGVTYPNVHWGRRKLGDVVLGAEVEFAHDWYDLGDYGDDRGLGTVAGLLTVTFQR